MIGESAKRRATERERETAAYQPVRQRGHGAGDEEPGGAVPKQARAGADEEQERRVEAVAEHPGQQPQVLADVAGDPEQREVALVGAEGHLERVRVEREGGAGAARHLHPHRRAEPQPRRPAPGLHHRRAAPHLSLRSLSPAERLLEGGAGTGVVAVRCSRDRVGGF